ncbi:neuropeptides capa receptor-like [Amphiura filiformis]|uniref:neuropeptides capa receptor-like n=1 Tax=Amphiura filiformis TaxID=82378 RepID=UPI003B21BA5A
MENADDLCSSTIVVNLTSEEAAMRWLWGNTDKLIITVILPCVVTIGVLGNLAFLFTVVRLKRMHTITNYYLCHLAIADILFLVVSAGLYIWVYFSSPITHDVPYKSSLGCCLTFFPIFLCYFSSVGIVTLVSLERYYAICNPIQHRAIQGMHRTTKFLASTWFVAILLAALATPRFGLLKQVCLQWPESEPFKHLADNYHDCFSVGPEFSVYPEVIQSLIFVISFTVSLFCYIKIVFALTHRSIEGDNTADNNVTQMQNVRNQIARLLILNGIVFFVCQAPYRVASVNNIIRIIGGEVILNKDGAGTLLLVSRASLFLNSAINPYLYALSSPFYRSAFREALFGESNVKTRKPTMTTPVASVTVSKNDTTDQIE